MSTDTGLVARLEKMAHWASMGGAASGLGAESCRVMANVIDEAIAALRWGDGPRAVGLCRVVRATTRNRALVARYPEVFAAAFPGSSSGWVRALTSTAAPHATISTNFGEIGIQLACQ